MSTVALERPPGAGAARRQREPIDGVLLLDKPRGLSSNHAMLAVRRLLGAAKAGHGGTLDPMASGLLPILLGEATKFAGEALDSDKTYLARLRLGETSSTADAEGEITSTGVAIPDRERITRTLSRFQGRIEQTPPMHSALKHQGRPLYELARQGATVDRAPRVVTLHALTLVESSDADLVVRVSCSKGTYIRVLAEDIGRALGCGAWLADLRREGAAGLALDHRAVTLDQIETLEPAERRRLVEPVDCLLADVERIDLGDEQTTRRFLSGQRLRVSARQPRPVEASPSSSAPGDRRVRVYGPRDPRAPEPALLGIAQLHDGVITPVRLISTQDQDRPR